MGSAETEARGDTPRLSVPEPSPATAAPPAGDRAQNPSSITADPGRFTPPGEDRAALTAIPDGAVVTGALLRKVRERRGISLRDIAQTTKVSLTYLQFIEEENFQELPVPAYLRGFLKAYAKCVGLDPDRVSHEYIKLYSLYHEIKGER